MLTLPPFSALALLGFILHPFSHTLPTLLLVVGSWVFRLPVVFTELKRFPRPAAARWPGLCWATPPSAGEPKQPRPRRASTRHHSEPNRSCPTTRQPLVWLYKLKSAQGQASLAQSLGLFGARKPPALGCRLLRTVVTKLPRRGAASAGAGG